MNTQKQIVVMAVLMLVLAGSCAAYTAIDLPYRAVNQEEYQLDESIERGALLFANNCRGCHGDRGQGGIGLPLNTEEYKSVEPLEIDANRLKLKTTLYCGRVGTFMQPWLTANGGSLNPIQIEHLIDLITQPSGVGWEHAVEFSHNLNHESPASVGGDTFASIAKMLRVGVDELLALNPTYGPDELLPKGIHIDLPANSLFPEGRRHKVIKNNETLARIADNQRVGQAILVDLNSDSLEPGKRYTFDQHVKRNTFTLLVDGNAVVGLFPGSELMLSTVSYTVGDTDTLGGLAERLGVSADVLRDLNGDVMGGEGEILGDLGDDDILENYAGTVLDLGGLETYVVKGQSIEDVARAYGGLTGGAEAFAEENDFSAEDVLRIGQQLAVPPDAWGVTPGGTPNNGKACIEHAVPQSVFEELTGTGEEPSDGPSRPSEVSSVVEVVAHATDWTVVADGTEQEINAGVAAVDVGTTVAFRNDEGIHTLTIDGETIVDTSSFPLGDVREITFDEAGTFSITCDIHPQMLATLFVGDEASGGGSSDGGSGDGPAISTSVEIVAHATDWTVTADGTEQPINEGEVAIEVGSTILFRNDEGVHTLTVDGETVVDLVSFPQGDTREITFDEAGTFAITCDIHPQMLATVFVNGS